MSMKYLIVAAGTGSRLQSHGPSKPLVDLCGKPIIARVMENAVKGGVDSFVVVTGYMADDLSSFVRGEVEQLGASLELVHNPDYDKPNGLSVVAARSLLDQPFILSMCDHVMDPAIVRTMMDAPISDDEVILGIDPRLDNPFVDLDDVTRVRMEGGLIRDIGKGIDGFNAYDTGIFKASPVLFDAIMESGQQNNDYSISGGMMNLAARDKAKGRDIGHHVWIDVDDPAAFSKAEAYLTAGSVE